MGRSVAKRSFAVILCLAVSAATATAEKVPTLWIPDHVVAENTPLTLTVVAVDPATPPSAFAYSMKLGDPPASGAKLSSTGDFSWTPSESQGPGTYPVTICAMRHGSRGRVTACAIFTITVLEVDDPPVANLGRPSSGVVNAPLLFDGSASSDPDGGPITTSWSFGDGDTSNCMVLTHTYKTPGIFNVKLRVTDLSGLHGDDATSVSIAPFYSARVFLVGGCPTISGELKTCFHIEPIADSFNVLNVDPSSIRVLSDRRVHADVGAGRMGMDEDNNGIPEMTACFDKADLVGGRPTGAYPILIEGNLTTGGSFQGFIHFHAGGAQVSGQLSASLHPNPIRFGANLRIKTSAAGSLSVALYDPQGRLVRVFARENTVAAGDHDIKIEAQDMLGSTLPSGIYYLQIQSSSNGETTKTIVITK